jgi:hypothetical protein
MTHPVILRCVCGHPASEHLPSLTWCTHRVDDAVCVCDQLEVDA